MKDAPWSDVYSLAHVGYEMLAGVHAHDDGSPLDHLAYAERHIHLVPPRLDERIPDLGRDLSDVLAQAMNSDPNERFRSMLAFGNALRAAYRKRLGGAGTAYLPGPRQEAPMTHRTPPSGEVNVLGHLARMGTDARFPLHEGVYIIGRDARADIQIDEGSISLRHARLVVTRTAITIADLDSRNGVRVRGQSASTLHLRHGDTLRLGRVSLELILYPGAVLPMAGAPVRRTDLVVDEDERDGPGRAADDSTGDDGATDVETRSPYFDVGRDSTRADDIGADTMASATTRDPAPQEEEDDAWMHEAGFHVLTAEELAMRKKG